MVSGPLAPGDASEAPSRRNGPSLQPNVCIIVLNWNGLADTLECVRSVLAIDYPNFEIIVVDNGSTDRSPQVMEQEVRKFLNSSTASETSLTRALLGNSIQVVSEAAARTAARRSSSDSPLSSRFVLIRNEMNLGFAAGNNVGIGFAIAVFRPRYVFLLNNDTVVRPTFLTKLVSSMEADPSLGVAGPRLVDGQLVGTIPSTPCLVGRIHWVRFPGYSYGLPRANQLPSENGILDCEWVSGAAMIIRAECFDHALLNAGYFFGCEDVEFCINLRKAGWNVGIRPDAIVWHKGGVSRKRKFPTRFRFFLSGVLVCLKFVRNNRRDYPVLWYIYVVTIALLVIKLKLEDYFDRKIIIARPLRGLQ